MKDIKDDEMDNLGRFLYLLLKIYFIVLLAGQGIFLLLGLFSGDIGSVYESTLEDSGFGGQLTVAMTAVADCWGIVKLVQYVNRRKKENLQLRETEARNQIQNLCQQYGLSSWETALPQPLWAGEKLPCFIGDRNTEVEDMVQNYGKRFSQLTSQCRDLIRKSQELLGRTEAGSVFENLQYLQKLEPTLKSMQEDFTTAYGELTGRKLRLNHEKEDLTGRLLKDMSSVESSRIFRSETTTKRDLLSDDLPRGLTQIFQYPARPWICRMGKFRYCFFSNVILVFDPTGAFSGALDPSALHVDVQKCILTAECYRQGSYFVDLQDRENILAEDSLLIQEKEVFGKCTFNAPGEPEKIRVETTWQYGKVKISVPGGELSFRISSHESTETLGRINGYYALKRFTGSNPASLLLSLFEMVSEEQTAASFAEMKERYGRWKAEGHSFCELI